MLGEVAFQVQQVAEGVERKAEKNEDLIMPEVDIYETIGVVTDQRHQVERGC